MARQTHGHRTIASDAASTTNDTVTVGVASTAIAAANPDRVALVICNDHATNVLYLSLGGTAVVNEGIRVNAAGGVHIIDYYDGAVAGVATGASTGVTIAEV